MPRSFLMTFGGFIALAAPAAVLPAGAAAEFRAAAERGIPLRVLAPGDPRLTSRYEARFALIRPDQHVAFRGDVLPADPGAVLERVTGHY